MGYDSAAVLRTVDDHWLLINSLMSICIVAVAVYYVAAIKVAIRDQAYPIPFAACGFYAVHDTMYSLDWSKWFSGYHHWWLELWAVANVFYAFLEFVMCFLVYRYGREELMPRLTQRQFGLSLLALLAGITILWKMLKPVINDDLSLISFAFTTFWPQVWATQLLLKRQSLRGMSRTMFWCMLGSPVGMFGSWYFLDPYFRTPTWLAFAFVTIGWSVFNIFLTYQYPVYVTHVKAARRPVGNALQGAH